MSLPDFRGRDLAIEPPFSFHGVTACVFPLRASLNSVQLLVDQHLNIIPRELGYFQATMPYVYMMVLDYGKLALKVTNLGWFSQREVTFAIPLEWYTWDDGEWIYKESAVFTPFVYVDDTLSMTLGRSVHGWPKTFVTVKSDVSNRLRDPSGMATDFALSANIFSRTYAGRPLEERVFLEVRSPGCQGMRLPPDADNPWFPWTMFSNMARNAFSFSEDAIHTMRGLGVLPLHAGSTPHNAIARSQSAAWKAFPFWPDVSAATLNLKQFRCLEKPDEYCYQALTSGPIRYTAFNRGGFLGDAAIAAGDASGGYSIALTTYPTTPLVETLGLKVDRRLSDESGQTLELRPVAPFWCNVDMEYERATNVAWRSIDGVWQDADGYRYPRRDKRMPASEKRFNTTLGAGSPVIPGPFHFSSVVSHVVPLLATARKLETYVKERLNEPLEGTGEEFRLWGRAGEGIEETAHVYLVCSSYGDIQSRANNVGDWANFCVAFYIPVQRYYKGEFVELGFTPVVAFADTVTQACTLSEVYGMSAIQATIANTRGDWLERDPDARGQLLHIEAEVLPAVGEGQKSRREQVVAIGELQHWRDPVTSTRESRRSAKLHQESYEARRCPPEGGAGSDGASNVQRVLKGIDPWTLFTLMQVRDAAEPSKACYQALHRIRLATKDDPQLWRTRRLYVDITEYPTLALVDQLGLVPVSTTQSTGPLRHRLLPDMPFRIQHSYGDDGSGAKREYHRTYDGDWKPGHCPASWFHKSSPPPPVGPQTLLGGTLDGLP